MKSNKKFLITIDGPAGAGKTTVSKMLARKLGYNYIDTGALYRGIAYEVFKKNITAEDEKNLKKICENINLEFKNVGEEQYLFSDNKDIEPFIRTEEISMLASAVSAKPFVRKALLKLQRDLGSKKCAVFEGRDMGTVVFPNADIKFFLEASVEERVARRYKQLANTSEQSLEDIKNQIIKRDRNDSQRKLAPLKPAEDAIIIDSTKMSAEEVIEFMISFIFG
ncbi:MAG: (d)CMP kinase [Deltaproteobacteria bacterium]|nr:(d)CMP kinase [Deltaproteobacteria bacterium]